MRKALVVASRELHERWLLPAAGLVIGCIPLLLPAFGIKPEHAVVLGGLSAFSLAVAAAIVTGASMLARDAADGRLAFLFARPLSWAQIWGGKWLAALVLVLGSGFLASAPWVLAFPGQAAANVFLVAPAGLSWATLVASGGRDAGPLLPALVVLVVGGVNLLATLYRARSPWLALDVALLLVALLAVMRFVVPISAFGLLGELGAWAALVWSAPLPLALLVGSAVQTAVGRTDLRRAHRALSAGFWAIVAVTLIAAAGYVTWVENSGPQDMKRAFAAQSAGDGRWLVVEGQTNRGASWRYQAGFLVDSQGSGYVATTDLDWRRWSGGERGDAVLSSDGRWALRPVRVDGGTTLQMLDLGAFPLRRSEVRLEASVPPTWWTAADILPAGRVAVVVQESSISLFALASGKALASHPLKPGWHVAAVRFRGDGVRAWALPAHPGIARASAPSEVEVVDLSASGARDAHGFTATTGLRLFGELVAGDGGERLLTLDGGLRLRDGKSGDVLAVLFEGEAGGARFLPDGRVVGIQVSARERVLGVYDAAGREQRSIDLGSPMFGGPVLGPHAGPGRVIVQYGVAFYRTESRVLDLDTGAVVATLDGLTPAPQRWWTSAVFQRPAQPGLFVDGEGRLLRVDLQSGRRSVLSGPGAPAGSRLARF